jgi:Fe-S-cluster containining protein
VRSILLLRSEAEHISKKTLKDVGEFTEKTEGFEPYIYRMKKTEDGKCMFLKDNSCTIYHIRPLVCMFYPFELKKEPLGNKHTFAYTAECPAIGKGSKLKKSWFERLFRKSIKAMRENGKVEL